MTCHECGGKYSNRQLLCGKLDNMHYSNFQTFNEMVAALYRGPFESPRWDTFLQLLKQECDADIAVIGLTRPGPKDYSGVAFWKSDSLIEDPDSYASYAEFDSFVNLPNGEAVTMHQVTPQKELEQSACYQEWLLPHNMHFILGIDIYKKDQVAIYLRLIRGANSKDFGDVEKSLLNALFPHVQNLILWLDRQEELNSERSIYESVVSHLALGTVAINDEGSIIKMNPIAEHILNSGENLYINQGRLACHSPSLNQSLQQMLLSAGNTNSPKLVDSLTVPRVNTATPLYLTIKPRVSSEFTSDMIAAHNMLFINAAEMHVTGSQSALQRMLGLTKAEARLAIELANGLTVDDISEKLHISINTVRTHISRLYQKTDVNKQTALVSMVLRCIASLNSPPNNADTHD